MEDQTAVPAQFQEYQRKLAAGEVEPAKRKVPAGSVLMRVIREKCIECMGGDEGYRNMIRDCSSYGCALRPYRPYQEAE